MKVFNQWRLKGLGYWSFVPFSVWTSPDFWGFVVLNFCFEFARTELARSLQESDSQAWLINRRMGK